jgi:uncharacterized membrane protein YphA (DoxX/SURF4 family)
MRTTSDAGLLALRIGLGLYFLVIGLLKFVSSGPILQMVYPMFYGGLAIPALIYIAGVIQILGGVLLIAGWQTMATGIVLGIMHLSTTIATVSQLFSPFKFPEGGAPHFLFFAAIPVLTAILALVLAGPGRLSADGT